MEEELPTSADVIVVGAGIAGLSAAVAAAESLGDEGKVLLVDRAAEAEAGGNTRWTAAYLRLDDVYEPGDNFVEDILECSDGQADRVYVERLLELIPETMDWAQSHGMRFRRQPTYFINSSRKRLQPVGGGEAMLRALVAVAAKHGVLTCHETEATGLTFGADGLVTGLEVTREGRAMTVTAPSIVLASGGFEGDPEWLERELGAGGRGLRPIAPGGEFNRGEGIAMALAAGAARAGQWDTFHAEPVDARSDDAEAIVMVFPYGIVVDKHGRRFVDEGRGTVDETYEAFARAVWKQDDGVAHFITDAQYLRVDDRARGVLSTIQPVSADSIEELADAIGVPTGALRETIDGFNAAAPAGTSDWRTPDGLSTSGVEPPKSNWAVPLAAPPYLSFPIRCSIVFTFGGIDTDLEARARRTDGSTIPGLFAAGECTGIYFGKYPGGTSVLRSMVFGKVGGAEAAAFAMRDREATRT